MSDKMKNMRIVLFLLFVAITLNVSAQTTTIKGKVKDKTGEAIIGASILEKGTSKGTITDMDGNFTLKVNANATVVVSYIGMKSQEISVKGKTTLDVTLQDDAQTLDEVVVIGYGTVAKKDLTGSVASVNAKQLEAIPVSSASEALTGKLPGVTITTTEGSPDANIKIRVRGGGSLSQDNSPLYIVDGFPVSSISDIAPSEIQSIDVLKDASSTAIYGARGANGVIIVTTKSGKEGKTQVDFGAYFGLKKATKFIKNLSPYDYTMYQYELGSTDYGTFNDLDIWKSVKGNDFQDMIFGRTGNQAQYNISISGGTKDTKYSISYVHNDEKSIMKKSGFNKDNINAKINTNINKWIKVDFNARLSYQTVKGLSSGADANESNAANSIVANAVRFRPVDALANNDDDEDSTTKQYNPVERLDDTYKNKQTFNQNYNAGVNWNPFKNITVRSEYGYGWKYTDTDQVWAAQATQNSKLGYSGRPQAVLTKVSNKNWRNANTITYDDKKMFNGRDKINAMIGHEVTSAQDIANVNTTVNFPVDKSIDEILGNMNAGEALQNQRIISPKENLLSFFGRLNYTMMDKYLLSVTMRTDGSSKFASGNRWGFFPSAALAWRMSDEAFMQHTQDWLSNLKLRLSYGTAGNNRIQSSLLYPTFSLSSATGKAPAFDGNNNTVMLEHGTYLPNSNLKWETTITRNFGIDYGFWKNRISGTLDFYWNSTKDLLMKVEIPGNSGYNYQYQNFGQTSNKGAELAVTATLADTKNFGLDFNFNISYNRSNIDKLNNDNPWQSSSWGGSTISKYEDFKIEKGGRIGEVWGYKTNGFFTPYDAVNNPNGELIWTNGAWKLKEGLADNSPTITGGSYFPGALKVQCDDKGNPIKQRLGNTVAPWNGGFGFNGHFKSFDFSAFFNYSIGNVLVNASKLATSFYAGSAKGYNLNNDFATSKRYTWIDPETGLNLGRPSSSTIQHYGSIDEIIAKLNSLNANAGIYNPAAVTTMQLTDYAIEKASFLRVNNVTIGYTLPKALIMKAHIQNVRVYLTGYNLFCFTNYSGADPEVDTSKNAMTPGIDYAAYPKSRSFIGGINVTF